jgi:hypothetical protein
MARRSICRVDSNQPEIVAAFRALGYSVHHTHMVGDGFVDIVVGKQGQDALVEIKDGSKPPSQRRLTPDEARFHATWKGRVVVVETTDDVARLDAEWFGSRPRRRAA